MNQVAVLSLGAALGVINTLLYPRLQAIWNVGGHAYIRSIVNCVCTASLCLGFASILLVQIVGTEVLTFVLGMSFVDTNALSLQIAATVLANVGQYLSWLHLFKVNSGRIRNVSLIAAGCGSALSVYMVLEFGIVGAGAGLLLSFLIYSGLMHAESTASRFLLLEFVVFAFVVLISQLVALWLTTFLIIVCMAVFGCAFFCRLKRLRSAQRHWKVLEIHAATVPGSQRES
jgi:O-antigen/teichoic acid export membrane protein